MLRHLLILPDGTQVFSGAGTVHAIQSVNLTECVNSTQELTLGSTCACMLEAKLITPGGGIALSAGDEVTLYEVEESGARRKVGLFTLEKPTRPSQNTMQLTAYDRITWLDKDMSDWLASLTGWPYSLLTFCQMVCQECGLTLLNAELPNGDYQIQKFSASGITGRKLMEWAGQITGRFCRATAGGEIEFAWYTPAAIPLGTSQLRSARVAYRNGNLVIDVDNAEVTYGNGGLRVDSGYLQISDDGQGNVTLAVTDTLLQQYCFMGGLSFEDYAVAPVEKVQLRMAEDDVGVIYPDVTGAVNTYTVTGNYLLTTESTQTLLPIAQSLYEQLKDITYTPCKVTVPAGTGIRAGNTVRITDGNGKAFTAYIMTRTRKGQRDTLECTGSHRRDSTTAVNHQSYKALNQRMTEIKTAVEGVSVQVSRVEEDGKNTQARLELESESLSARVSREEEATRQLQGQYTAVTQRADAVDLSVTQLRKEVGTKAEQAQLSELSEHFRFDADGMTVTNSGTGMGIGVSEQRVVFTGGADPTTVITPNAMQTTNLTVGVRLDVGGFSLIPRNNGNLSLRYTGG